MYNGKSTLTASTRGVYVGIDGISLGAGNTFSVTEAGYITAISGNIGGAQLASNSIHASNGNWYINSDGTASFKHIEISTWAKVNGVQWGSQFGSLQYDNGITWGSFRGASTYGSNSAEPFKGNCVTHIQSIAADYIYARYLKAMQADISSLYAETARIDNLVATKASIQDLNAVSARVGTIEADYITTAKLNAHTITADHLKAGSVNGHYVSWRGVSICYDVEVVADYYTIEGQRIHIVTGVTPRYYTKYIMASDD